METAATLTSHHGRRSTTTSVCGAMRTSLNGSTMVCARRCEQEPVANVSRAARSSTVNPSERRKKGAPWLRRRQESEWTETASGGRHPGLGAQAAGACCRCGGSRRRPAGAGGADHHPSAPAPTLGGCGLPRQSASGLVEAATLAGHDGQTPLTLAVGCAR